MTKRVEIPTLLNYCDLDTVIEELTRLRDQYGGECMVDVELEPVPYENRDTIVATLEVRE